MMKVIGYQALCKKCGYVHAKSNIPQIQDMPAQCIKCAGDMSIEPVYEEDGYGFTYEVTVFCKENGVTERDGAVVTSDEMKSKSEKEIRQLVQLRIAEAMLRIVGASKTDRNETKLARLTMPAGR